MIILHALTHHTGYPLSLYRRMFYLELIRAAMIDDFLGFPSSAVVGSQIFDVLDIISHCIFATVNVCLVHVVLGWRIVERLKFE